MGCVRVALGSDHAGLELKEALAKRLVDLGHEPDDLGTHGSHPVDYPDYGAAVGRAVVRGEAALGVCCCGTGIGIAMAANKVPGVRAAVVHDVTSARLAREHNDANVCCLGARLVGVQAAVDALEAFLSASFAGGRHAARVAKLAALEEGRR